MEVHISSIGKEFCVASDGAGAGAQAHRRQCVPNPRLHEPRSKPYLLMFQINLVSN